jgi:hypothetical protein
MCFDITNDHQFFNDFKRKIIGFEQKTIVTSLIQTSPLPVSRDRELSTQLITQRIMK